MATPIGTITLTISENHRTTPPISEEDAPFLVGEVRRYFNYLLVKEGLNEQFTVTDVQWSMGCITIVISIGLLTKLLLAGGILTGAAAALKQYKEGREGLGETPRRSQKCQHVGTKVR